MSFATQTILFDPWSVEYHKLMAATAETALAVKRKASIISLARDFWSVSKRFKDLLTGLNKITSADVGALEELNTKLGDLHLKVATTIQAATSCSLTNRTLTAGSIRSIEASNSALEELIERFSLSLDVEVQTGIKESWQEYQRGETVSLDSIL